MEKAINIFWFRRDLRFEDNAGLFYALNTPLPVLPIFIFDTHILSNLPKDDARVTFIYNTVFVLHDILQKKYEAALAMFYGKPFEIFEQLIGKLNIKNVFTNSDYEPYALERDTAIEALLVKKNIKFHQFKDHVIFEKKDIVKNDGNPYLVYTPYMKKWKETFYKYKINSFNSEALLENTLKNVNFPKLSLKDMGFNPSLQQVKPYNLNSNLIKSYEETRNFPAKDSTSHLGPHLRFGTVSIRKVTKIAANEPNETFLQELIWREFFIQILWHFPHIVTRAFKPKYDRIIWRNNEQDFKLWCQGKTGYPIVDAGIRQLNKTGFMHNRVRMIVGSFLCKHLLIDWRWGEAYFAEKLHDYEMASNVGNWQWVAGCGVDAAPYFRIFNPATQTKKFDKNLEYIEKWVPNFQELNYPNPIVAHQFARQRCIAAFKKALQ